MLLVHGLSSYSGTWWRVASELAERGCHVVAPDLRGHGLSPSTSGYGFAAMAAEAGFTVKRVWTDAEQLFSVQYCVRD